MTSGIFRNGLLIVTSATIGLFLGKAIWHAPTVKGVSSEVSNEFEPKVPIPHDSIKGRELVFRETHDPRIYCDLNSYPLSEIKIEYDKKNDEVRETILSRFAAAKTEREKKERNDALGPLVLPIALESQYWAADWMANVSGEEISLTLVWFIHEDGKGFGFEVFAPDKRQVLGLGAGLDYASPLEESWFVIANVSEKKIDQIISGFAFAIPTSKSRVVPTEYLMIDEKNWRNGPEISWHPISRINVENMRKDAARAIEP